MTRKVRRAGLRKPGFLVDLRVASLEQLVIPSAAGPVWATRLVWARRDPGGVTESSLHTVVVDN